MKEISGYEGKYFITREGKVINRFGRVRTNQLDRHGYARVLFSDKKGGLIHRLVAIAFIPNPENKPQVNHKNGIRHDNRVENLEWCTPKENIQHSFRNGRIGKSVKGENSPQHILKAADIPVIRMLLMDGKKSLREIGEMYNVSLHTIYSVKSGKNWKHIQ